MTRFERPSTALSPAAMLVAVLALVLAAGGIGYAAGSVGTKDLKSGAVTSAKVRDGSLRAKDLVPEEAFSYAGDPGGPVLRDGGEGDCVWTDAAEAVPGLTPVGFRVDRFGTVHLSGVAQSTPVPGAGDGECGGTADEVDEDGIVFILPRRYWPAASVLVGHAEGVLIAGPGGLDVEGGTSAPAGAVVCTSICALEGITYVRAGSPVAAVRPPSAGNGPGADRVLQEFGLHP